MPAKELCAVAAARGSGRSPAQRIEIPSDTLSEQHVVTILSPPSLLFIGEALPKIAFLLALS